MALINPNYGSVNETSLISYVLIEFKLYFSFPKKTEQFFIHLQNSSNTKPVPTLIDWHNRISPSNTTIKTGSVLLFWQTVKWSEVGIYLSQATDVTV